MIRTAHLFVVFTVFAILIAAILSDAQESQQAQRERFGAPPKAASPRNPATDKGIAERAIEQAIGEFRYEMQGYLAKVMSEHAKIADRQKEVERLLNEDLQMRQLVYTTAEAQRNTAASLKRHTDEQGQDPADYAVLKAEVQYLLSGLGLLITGGAGWIFKTIKDNKRILEAVKLSEDTMHRRHSDLVERVAEATTASHQVFNELSAAKIKNSAESTEAPPAE